MPRSLRQLSNHAINLGVLVLALLPLVYFSAKPWTNAIENRHSSPPPSWPHSTHAWRQFPAAFEAFFNDSFGLRKSMIGLRNNIDYWVLGKSPITLVMRGRNHWLFYVGDNSIADYMGRPTLSDNDLMTWDRALRTRHDVLAARGIPYYFVVAPNKQSIYPEFMPPAIYHGKVHAIDRLLTTMGKSGVPSWVIDLRPAMLAAKSDQTLFQLLDVHWNDYGAFIGYQALADVLARDKIAVNKVAIPASQFIITDSFPGGNLDDMLGLHDRKFVTAVQYGGPVLPCSGTAPAAIVRDLRFHVWNQTDIETKCAAAGNTTSALIFHDSMMDAMHGYLYASFGHSRYVWSYPAIDDMLRYVDAAHPSVVIEERVERELVQLPPPPPPPQTPSIAVAPAAVMPLAQRGG